MGRIAQPGILYYYTDVKMIHHKKLKLLYSEFDSHGHWVYSCLLSEIYREKGYYLDLSDEDFLPMFASDVCKKPVSLVNQIIGGCIRRGLFSKALFDVFKILTSDRIQEVYIDATSERRRKGTTIELREDLLLIPPDETWQNVLIHGKNGIVPRNNLIDPRPSTQSKVKESKVKESKEREVHEHPHSPDFLEIIFKKYLAGFAKNFPTDHFRMLERYKRLTGDSQKEEEHWNFVSKKFPDKAKFELEKAKAKFQAEEKSINEIPEKILRAEIEKFRKWYAAREWKLTGGLSITDSNCIDVFGTWLERKKEHQAAK